MSDLPPPQVRSVSEINETDPDFEEQLTLLYPSLSKRKDRVKSYKAQRKLVDDEFVPIGDKIGKFAGKIAGKAKETVSDTVADVKAARQAKEGDADAAETEANRLPASLDAPIPPAPQPAPRPLQEITEDDPDFDAQLVMLYPNLSKPKDREKSFKAQTKMGSAAFPQTESSAHASPEAPAGVSEPTVPASRAEHILSITPRTKEAVRNKTMTGRAGEIVGDLRDGETPLLYGYMQMAPEANPDTDKNFTLQGGAFMITDQRLLLNSRLLLSRNHRNIELADVQSVDLSTYLMTWNRVTVRTPSGPVVFDVPRNKDDAQLVKDTMNTAAAAARKVRHTSLQPSQPPEPAAGRPSKATELKELFELHQMGALTDEEYATAKAQVLAG